MEKKEVENKVKADYSGSSSDGRTSVWLITCICGKQYTPPTTIFAQQQVHCPKCGHYEVIDYNKITHP